MHLFEASECNARGYVSLDRDIISSLTYIFPWNANKDEEQCSNYLCLVPSYDCLSRTNIEVMAALIRLFRNTPIPLQYTFPRLVARRLQSSWDSDIKVGLLIKR